MACGGSTRDSSAPSSPSQKSIFPSVSTLFAEEPVFRVTSERHKLRREKKRSTVQQILPPTAKPLFEALHHPDGGVPMPGLDGLNIAGMHPGHPGNLHLGQARLRSEGNEVFCNSFLNGLVVFYHDSITSCCLEPSRNKSLCQWFLLCWFRNKCFRAFFSFFNLCGGHVR